MLVTLSLSFVALASSPPAPRAQEPLEFRQSSTPERLGRLIAHLRFDGERFVANAGDYELLRWPGRRRTDHAQALPLPLAPRATATAQRRSSTLCIDATTSSGFFAAGTTGTEWLDWATKACGRSNSVTRIDLGYSSSARDVTEGGPGGALRLSLYEDSDGFCDDRGKLARSFYGAEASFDFFSLPGATGTQVAPGYLITAYFPDNDAICLADGPIGWSYTFLDSDGTGVAQTGPSLTYFHTNTGWEDAFDLYDGDDCTGTFFFGGCLPPMFPITRPCGGFYVGLAETSCTTTPSIQVLNHPSNPSNLQPGTSPDFAGVFDFVHTPLTASSFSTWVVSAGTGSTGMSPSFLGGTRLFAAPPHLARGDLRPMGGSPLRRSLRIPKHTALCAESFTLQAFDVRPGPAGPVVRATNALVLTIGS